MATAITLPEGAPEEVITHSFVRDVDLTPFGFTGNLALITIDNGLDHTRPNTLGAKTLMELDAAITDALSRKPAGIAIIGKPFIFAAGADLSGLAFLSEREQSIAFGKLGHDVFRRLDESGTPTFAFINGLALGGGLEIGLHCNYRTLASTAFTALPEVFLGLIPGWGGATILPKLIGPERAVQVIIGLKMLSHSVLWTQSLNPQIFLKNQLHLLHQFLAAQQKSNVKIIQQILHGMQHLLQVAQLR